MARDEARTERREDLHGREDLQGTEDLRDEKELRVQRTEEELRAGTREREAGQVRVRKDVRTDREQVRVPTRHEGGISPEKMSGRTHPERPPEGGISPEEISGG